MTSAADRAAQVLAAEAAWSQAFREGDWETLAAMMAPEYLQIGAGGRLTDREAMLASLQGEQRQWEIAESDQLEVRVYGDKALLVGRWRGKGVNHGQPFDYQARFACLYVWRDGRWLVAYEQSTEMPLEE
jgi:uncharacterized protein (TIGR02246 family)